MPFRRIQAHKEYSDYLSLVYRIVQCMADGVVAQGSFKDIVLPLPDRTQQQLVARLPGLYALSGLRATGVIGPQTTGDLIRTISS